MTRYFQLSYETDKDCSEVTSPFDQNGNSCVSGEPLPLLGPCIVKLLFPEFTRLPDMIPSALTLVTLSCRAAKLFRSFRLQEGAQFVPAHVLHPDGKELGRCECIHFPTFLKVLDEDHTIYKYSECMGRKIPMRAIVPVVKKEYVKGIDLLESLHARLICSEQLKNAIEEAGLTNFDFEELAVI